MTNFFYVVTDTTYNIIQDFGFHTTAESALKAVAFWAKNNFEWDTEEHDKAFNFLNKALSFKEYKDFIELNQYFFIADFWIDNTPKNFKSEEEEEEWEEFYLS